MRRHPLFVALVCGAGLTLGLVLAVPVRAAGTVGDGTPASCTEAALDAALVGGGVITFNCGLAPVTITFTGVKTITDDTTIDGAGLITFSGGDSVPLFHISDAEVEFIGLVLADGFDLQDGGAIRGVNADISIFDSTVTGNSVTGGGGGAILLAATDGTLSFLIIDGSTFVGNSAGGDGGTIAATASTDIGGGCAAEPSNSQVLITNSTFTANVSGGEGSVLFLAEPGEPCGDAVGAQSYFSTFAGNDGDSTFFSVVIEMIALGANVIGPNDNAGLCGVGTKSQFGFNVTDDGSCFPAITGDKVVADTMLSVLADNGGPTRTMALLPGSPAVDAVVVATVDCLIDGIIQPCPTGGPHVDQRGVSRPQGPAEDAGAYELVVLANTAAPASPAPSAATPAGLLLLMAGLGSLAVMYLRSGRMRVLHLDTDGHVGRDQLSPGDPEVHR